MQPSSTVLANIGSSTRFTRERLKVGLFINKDLFDEEKSSSRVEHHEWWEEEP
ncbi:Uncharacterised protein [Vibrio cholerae]|nr:Uncharacterised protein [Vibrio cholerae]